MRRSVFVLWVLLLILGRPGRSCAVFGAGDIVFDPSNLAQQLTHYAQMVKTYATQMNQYIAQLQQLQYQYNQLQNELQNLKNLNWKSDLTSLEGLKKITGSVIRVTDDFTRVQNQFDRLFPGFDTYQGQTSQAFYQKTKDWHQQSQQNALDIVTTTQKIQDLMNSDHTTLNTLNDRSASASGAKDLSQTTNQLLILQTKQMMQLQQIISSVANADANVIAEKAAQEEAAKSRSEHLYQNWDTTGERSINPQLDHLH